MCSVTQTPHSHFFKKNDEEKKEESPKKFTNLGPSFQKIQYAMG
jgi:hypothetical protein